MQIKDLENIIIKNKKYVLASKIRIFLAGILDLIFSSIPSLIISVIFYFLSKNEKNTNVYLFPSLLLLIGFIWLIFYFIFIPFISKGRTLCKMLFGLKLYKFDNSKIKITDILIRESILIFIPWIIGIVSNLISFLVLKININDLNNKNLNVTLLRMTSTFYLIWYILIILGVWLDKKNQLFFDHKLKIFIIQFNQDLFIDEEKEIIKRTDNHIHLKNNQPGNLDKDVIKELENLNKPERENEK